MDPPGFSRTEFSTPLSTMKSTAFPSTFRVTLGSGRGPSPVTLNHCSRCMPVGPGHLGVSGPFPQSLPQCPSLQYARRFFPAFGLGFCSSSVVPYGEVEWSGEFFLAYSVLFEFWQVLFPAFSLLFLLLFLPYCICFLQLSLGP